MEKFKLNLFDKMDKKKEPDEMTLDQAMNYMQPRHFTRGRNMYSQIKDPQVNLDFFTQSLGKKE